MKVTYIDLIKAIENKDTEKIIGKIKINLLNVDVPENLFYIFPLIERMVLEIYKLVPGANIEQYEKRIMKTINSILEQNKELEIIPIELSNKIRSYYKEDGLRNKLFHVNIEKQVNFKINIDEINYIIMHLLSILKNLDKNNQIKNLKLLEKL